MFFTIVTKIITICLFFALNQTYAKNSIEPSNITLKSIKDSIDLYYHTFDTLALAKIVKSCDSFIAQYPRSYYLNYYSGVLKMNLGKIYYNIDSDYAYRLFTQSVDNLHIAESTNRTAEICALLSAAYGKRSSLAGLNAIFLGMKAKSWIFDASDLDKYNAKINLVAATHLMHLPSFYGGDKDKARKLLNDAFKINKKNQATDSLALKWADDAEIHAYLAQLEILENKPEKARYHMDEALKSRPKYGFVLYDLTQQLKKMGY